MPLPPFLHRLLTTPGPSAFEAAPARVWREEAAFADAVTSDRGGNSFATLRAAEGAPRVMFAGHIDEIGLQVSYIDDDGYLSFDGIGGWDPQVFVGQRVLILARGGEVRGVVGKKAIHLMDADDRTKVSKIDTLWVDIGARNREEAAARVRVGDPGVLDVQPVEFPNDRVVSRCMDNRLGAYVVLEALRLLANADERPAAEVTAVATTREEIAYSGGGARSSATALEPHCAIVVDVTHATDCPFMDKRKHGDYKLGGGPVISRGASLSELVFEQLVAAAEREGIPYSLEASSKDTHTDAEAIFNAHRGVATGLVSIPLRYMHSPNEMVALEDVRLTARLLAAFARSVAPGEEWIAR